MFLPTEAYYRTGTILSIEAARIRTLRGHDVTLYEKSDTLGGVFTSASAPDFKEADKKLITWYVKQITAPKANVKLNTEVTPEMVRRVAADTIVMAVGYNPYVPLAEALKDSKEIYTIGDASHVGNLMDVV